MGLPSSPNLSILNRKSNGGQQQQDQRGCSAEKWQLPNAPPPIRVRKRRKLVLRNKAPMWNETSQVGKDTFSSSLIFSTFSTTHTSFPLLQVYQLDFGGRVTQESAKNFQIEYKDKQVGILNL